MVEDIQEKHSKKNIRSVHHVCKRFCCIKCRQLVDDICGNFVAWRCDGVHMYLWAGSFVVGFSNSIATSNTNCHVMIATCSVPS